jgi:hypothetical protein
MPTDVGAIAREHVEALIVHLRGTRSASTAEIRFRGLRRSSPWLEEEGEIERAWWARCACSARHRRSAAEIFPDAA